jgi:hypothetical protein
MKWQYAVALCVVAATSAFGQQGGKGGGAAAPKPAAAAPSDSGPDNSSQVKSINQILDENQVLTAKLQALLPADVNPHQACAGYKTLDQCASTIHVAHDANIPFAGLKALVTGKHSVGLEKAVGQLAPSIDAKDAVKKARKAASEDLKGISLFG